MTMQMTAAAAAGPLAAARPTAVVPWSMVASLLTALQLANSTPVLRVNTSDAVPVGHYSVNPQVQRRTCASGCWGSHCESSDQDCPTPHASCDCCCTCMQGYHLQGSLPLQQCVKDAPPPPPPCKVPSPLPAHTQAADLNGCNAGQSLPPTSHCTIWCDAGYAEKASGTYEFQCSETGRLSEPSPSCEECGVNTVNPSPGEANCKQCDASKDCTTGGKRGQQSCTCVNPGPEPEPAEPEPEPSTRECHLPPNLPLHTQIPSSEIGCKVSGKLAAGSSCAIECVAGYAQRTSQGTSYLYQCTEAGLDAAAPDCQECGVDHENPTPGAAECTQCSAATHENDHCSTQGQRGQAHCYCEPEPGPEPQPDPQPEPEPHTAVDKKQDLAHKMWAGVWDRQKPTVLGYVLICLLLSFVCLVCFCCRSRHFRGKRETGLSDADQLSDLLRPNANVIDSAPTAVIARMTARGRRMLADANVGQYEHKIVAELGAMGKPDVVQMTDNEMASVGMKSMEIRRLQEQIAIALAEAPPQMNIPDKFTGGAQTLVMGRPAESAIGIKELLGIAHEPTDALAAIEAEWLGQANSATEYAATNEDRDNYQCVLAGTANINADPPWQSAVTVAELLAHPSSQAAKLKDHHIVALRMYTSSSYFLINRPLRERVQPHPYSATVFFLNEAIKQLRSVGANSSAGQTELILWRGMRDVGFTTEFQKIGGTELACASTTTSKEVAMHEFARVGSADLPVIFKFVTADFMSRGADIAYASVYPNEHEMLYPPLTYLKPERMDEEDVDGAKLLVATVRPQIG